MVTFRNERERKIAVIALVGIFSLPIIFLLLLLAFR